MFYITFKPESDLRNYYYKINSEQLLEAIYIANKTLGVGNWDKVLTEAQFKMIPNWDKLEELLIKKEE